MPAVVNREECVSCGTCVEECPEEAITFDDDEIAVVDVEKCTECKTCIEACPTEAISMDDEWPERPAVDSKYPTVIPETTNTRPHPVMIHNEPVSVSPTDTRFFDVFLCHNTIDKPTVRKVYKLLKERGIRPWLDEEQLRPGEDWLDTLQKQIVNINSAAVFIGKEGVGPWQDFELKSVLRRFVKRRCAVIPVLLPNAPDEPELPFFIEGFMWVDFRKKEPDPLKQLIWGITGRKE